MVIHVTEKPIGGLAETVPCSREELVSKARSLADEGAKLDAIVPEEDVPFGFTVHYICAMPHGRKIALSVSLSRDELKLPSLVGIWPEADWPERRMRDMFGIAPVGHPRAARLVRHENWPKGFYPLDPESNMPEEWPIRGDQEMRLLRVRGEGVHEIPVGPIHAGIIEAGHFRFYADGERVLGLELRHFYKHRGVEKLAVGRDVHEGLKLAEVVSGDSAIAHSWAYCRAVETALGIGVGAESLALRGLLLEAERISNHIGDMGAILNDIAFGLAFAEVQGIREDILRAFGNAVGHRFLRGVLAVGGVSRGIEDVGALVSALKEAVESAQGLAGMALSRASVLERLQGTGVLDKQKAEALHAVGVVAKASGLSEDARRFMGAPYPTDFTPVVFEEGDVEARFRVRLEEISVSMKLIESFAEMAANARPGRAETPIASGASGVGTAEGWRGECIHFIRVTNGTIARWMPRDPSSLNWPLMPSAVAGNVVPDFPLINKSFNLSYAGNDL